MRFGATEIVTVVAVLAVLAVLAFGLGGFARGANPKTSNRRMWWRVIAQAVAVALILLTVWLRGRG